MGLPHALYRTGGRDQYQDALSRSRFHWGSAEWPQEIAERRARALVLGIAYKRDIDDLGESSSLTIIELLQKEGAQISYHDPYFPFIGKGRRYDLQMKRTELDHLGRYDCIVIVTDHSDYTQGRDFRAN